MSVGHHRHFNYIHRSDLLNELDRHLANPSVRSYLGRSFRVDNSHKIPLTGGSARDGSVYFIDSDLPPELGPFVLYHERVEKALRDVLRMSYARAHELATAAERMLVEAKGRDWSLYKSEVARYVRANEHIKAPPPPNLDIGPYEESGMMHLLQHGG